MTDTVRASPATSIRFLSWNVRGSNSSIKRSKVLSHLKRLNAYVIFLQETHLRDRDQVRLKSPWINDIFHSTFDSKARGVAILVNKRVHYHH